MLLMLLAACGGSGEGPTVPPNGAEPASADGIALGRVGNVAVDRGAVLLGTHRGLLRQQRAASLGGTGERFDQLSLTVGASRWLAAGHPPPGSALGRWGWGARR